IASCYATKTVKANDIIKKLEKGESIEIADAVVEGVLDFSSVGKPSPVNSAMFEARVRGNVFFYKCAFKDAVIAQKNNVRTRFDGNLVFLESEFQKEANFSDAAVFGTVNFSKSIFKESADFNQMAMWSKSIYFSEIAASKKFSLEGSSLHGALSIMNSKFLGKFSLQEVFIQGNLQASNASFDGSTDFAMLKVGNRAIFRYATFKHKPDFGASKFAEAPEM
ncbi:MAG: pentapeptide repeat-containing protein, partial [Fibromonadaceae bacterium]|nr:pentapeptide repeat-containing protein [Fibromonadaceae bacterium]